MTVIMPNQAWTSAGRSQYIGRPKLSVVVDEAPEEESGGTWAIDIDDADHRNAQTYFAQGLFNVSVSGTFVGTVTLQRSFDAGVTWQDVEEFTAATERVVDNAGQHAMWRLGVKEGDYVSGSITLYMNQ